jgi:hypothetical protein
MKQLSSIDPTTLFNALSSILHTRFGALPEKGVVAGQAVASACYEYIGIGTGPYNDLDIFVTKEEAPYCPDLDDNCEEFTAEGHVIERMSNPFRLPKQDTTTGAGNCLQHSSFGCSLHESINAGTYKIEYAYNDLDMPEFNWVRINFTHMEEGKAATTAHNALNILKGFDINAVEIALDMQEKKVVWTDAFQNFLYRPNLEATFIGTPMHTAIRLCRKSDDLMFAHLNMRQQMTLLQTARAGMMLIEQRRISDHQDEGRGYLPGSLFSSVYKERFEAIQSRVLPYFSLVEKKCTFNNQYKVMRPQVNGEIKPEYIVDTVYRVMHVLEPTEYCQDTIDGLTQEFSRVDSNGNAYSTITIESFLNTFPLHYNLIHNMQKKRHSNKLSSLFESTRLESRHLMRTCLLNSKDMRGVSKTHIDTINTFYIKHPVILSRMEKALDTLRLPLIYDFVRQMRWLEKNHMSYYIGWLENCYEFNDNEFSLAQSRSERARKHSVSMSDPEFRNKMKQHHTSFLSEIAQNHTTPHIPNILHSLNSKLGYTAFVELTCEVDFFWEGERLGHCIGGYFDAAMENNSLFVGINHTADCKNIDARSSICIHFPSLGRSHNAQEDPPYARIAQHFGRGNSMPSEQNKALAGMLITAVNEQRERILANQHIEYEDLNNITQIKRFKYQLENPPNSPEPEAKFDENIPF